MASTTDSTAMSTTTVPLHGENGGAFRGVNGGGVVRVGRELDGGAPAGRNPSADEPLAGGVPR